MSDYLQKKNILLISIVIIPHTALESTLLKP
jgi:hypothetical protein